MPSSTQDQVQPQDSAWADALSRGVCLHCGGELGRSRPERDSPFCCRGCQTVHSLIHQTGLQRYYQLRRGQQAPSAQLRPDSLAWLDQLLSDRHPSPAGAGCPDPQILRLTLDIQGVHCAACVWLLEELYRREPAGLDLKINPCLGQVDLAWDATRGDLKDYLRTVENFGYRFGPAHKREAKRSRALLVRLAICIAVALNVMMFSLSYYFGLAPQDGALYVFFGRLSFLLATVSVLVGGQVFFQGAIAGLRRRVAHLDLPISLGIALAYGGSVWAYAADGPRSTYFDTLTLFVALMLVGRWAQEHVLERNRNALLDAAGFENLTAKRQVDGGLQAVPAVELRAGDEIWVAPGDLVPVAGILLRRDALIALDWITGESEHKNLEPGEIVPAGAFNAGNGGFAMTAAEDFADSRLQNLLRAGPGQAREPNGRPNWWSRVASAYVAAVLGLALVGFLLWLGEGLQQAVQVAIAILVVTCPCALGLATPLAHELIHFALRQRGIFLRRASFLDRALSVRKVLLDKTGTLTLGQLVLAPESREQLQRLSAADRMRLRNMTARSNHPVSRCLAVAIGTGSGPDANRALPGTAPDFDPTCEDLSEEPGQGLVWHHQGHVWRLGRPEFALAEADAAMETIFSRDGQPLAAFRFREEFKADAVDELQRLGQEGYQIYLLSGDAEAKVKAAAKALHLRSDRALGDLTPEAKATRVHDLDRHDTLMVGDGLNDGPSFEAAFCAATPAVDRPVLPGKADFYFLGDGLAAPRRALLAARRLRRVVRDNLIIAVVYNVLAVSLGLTGLVTPVVAAILMPASSVAVVSLTAWRLSGRRLAWIS